MNIRIPYIMNPTHEGKHSTTILTNTKTGKIKKIANIKYRAIVYTPRLVIYKDDIFG